MKRKLTGGQTSVSLPIFIQDTSSTTGGGLSGVTHTSSGLVIEYRRRGQSTWTTSTPVFKTLGSFIAWGIVADGALAGAYELDLPDAAFASGARWVVIRVRGVTNMLPVLIEIELDAVDYQDSVRFGLTAMPNIASGSAGALLTSGTGTAQLATSSGLVTLAGVTHTGAVIPTVTDVTTKTGYALSQAFPANFASMALTVGGAVTVGTNNDKTGYSLLAGTGLGNQTANLTGNLSGSVGSVTGLAVEIAAIQAKTDLIPASPAAVSDIPTTSAIAIAVAGTQALSRLDSMIESNGAGQFRFDLIAMELAPTGTGGGGGSTDWTIDERTAIRSILGIPGSGTTPADPTVGILDTIRDNVGILTGYVDTEVAAIKAKTDLIPSQPAAVGSAMTLTVAYDASKTAASQASVDIVAGYIDTEVAAIKAKTDLIPAAPASTTNITAASGIIVSAIGNNVITAASIAADAGEELANALLDLANGVETSTTLRQAIRLIVAASAGKVNGAAGSTVNIRNLADTLNRITATVDADGNRTAITTNLG